MFLPPQLRKNKPPEVTASKIQVPIRATPAALPKGGGGVLSSTSAPGETRSQPARAEEPGEEGMREMPRKRLRLSQDEKEAKEEEEEGEEGKQRAEKPGFTKRKVMATKYRYGNFDGYYSYRITDDFEEDSRSVIFLFWRIF